MSFIIALAFWMWAIQSQEFSVLRDVSIRYDHDPALALLDPPPARTRITLRGTGMSMLLFQLSRDYGRMELRVDLKSLSPDTLPASHRVALQTSFLPSVPPDVVVTDFSPSFADIRLDRVLQRSLPVAVRTTVPARFLNVAVEPARVQVTGPASLIAELDSLYTDPVSLSITGGQVTPLVPVEGVRSSVDLVTITLKTPVPMVRSPFGVY